MSTHRIKTRETDGLTWRKLNQVFVRVLCVCDAPTVRWGGGRRRTRRGGVNNFCTRVTFTAKWLLINERKDHLRSAAHATATATTTQPPSRLLAPSPADSRLLCAPLLTR